MSQSHVCGTKLTWQRILSSRKLKLGLGCNPHLKVHSAFSFLKEVELSDRAAG